MPDAVAIRAVTEPLQTLGIALPDEVDRLQAIIRAAKLPDPITALLADVDTLTETNVVARLREAALDAAARAAAGPVVQRLHAHVGTAMAASLRDAGDDLVMAMRERFDPAAAAVAAAVGLVDPYDDAEKVLGHGKQAADAYLAMRPAVATLETVLAARVALTTCGYGRADVPAALVVAPADAPTNAALRRAGNLYRDTHRTGGRWLALADGGYRLHLGTVAEVAALIDDAATATAKAKEEAQRPRATAVR